MNELNAVSFLLVVVVPVGMVIAGYVLLRWWFGRRR